MRWKRFNLFSTSHQQAMSSHFLVSRASLGIAVITEDKCSNECPSLLSLIAGQTWYGMEYPFSQLDQLSWLWPLPRSCPPPAHRQEGSVGETALLQCQHCSATAKTLGCEQHLSRYQHSTAQGGLQCGKGAPAHPDPRQCQETRLAWPRATFFPQQTPNHLKF